MRRLPPRLSIAQLPVRATGVLVWKGIPFAAPPVGELRSKPPRDRPERRRVRPDGEPGRSQAERADLSPAAARQRDTPSGSR
jgi:carboxylesterase type B